jgi:hypothetical protein
LTMVHRNKEAVPVLIQLLNDGNPSCEMVSDRILYRCYGPYIYFIHNRCRAEYRDHKSVGQKVASIYGLEDDDNMPHGNAPINENILFETKAEWIAYLLKQWGESKQYIYIDRSFFEIDEEAKSAGISTDEYRKTHPWPKEEQKDKPK